jgi:hypothetical protein
VASSSYSGIPLYNPGGEVYARSEGVGGSTPTYGQYSPTPTPAGLLYNEGLGQLGNLYNFGMQGAGIGGELAGATGAASGESAIGAGLNGLFTGDLSYANQALATAFDPNQSIMKADLAQVQDQTNASLANSGLASTPYGASVNAGAAGNFMNNWQTQQVQRENTGMSTATGLQNQYLGGQTAAAGIMNQAGQLDLGAAQAQLQQYGLQGDELRGALSALTALFGDQRVSTSGSGEGGPAQAGLGYSLGGNNLWGA